MEGSVILVDPQDSEIGTAEKLKVHLEGLCHRAFSIFIYREVEGKLEFLIHQRAACKYHTPSYWTNTCCSHPRPGEEIHAAAARRLKEEMGIDSDLKWVGKFHYLAHLENGLIENEVDHVFIGQMKNPLPHPDPNEVQDYRWATLEQIQKEQSTHLFTPWFNQALIIALIGIKK